MAAVPGAGESSKPAKCDDGSDFPTFDASDEAVFKACKPDAPSTLGGWVEETEPSHPSVIMHMITSLMPG